MPTSSLTLFSVKSNPFFENRKKGKIVPRTSQIVKNGDTEVAKTPKMRQEHQNIHDYILKTIFK